MTLARPAITERFDCGRRVLAQVGGVRFDHANMARERYWRWRGPYVIGFPMRARKS